MRLKLLSGTFGSLCLLFVLQTCWAHEESHSLSSNVTTLSLSEMPKVRVKREHGSCVTGVSGGMSPGGGQAANGAASAASGGRGGRRKRSLSIDIQKHLKLPSFKLPRISLPKLSFGWPRKSGSITGRQKILTRTQRRFDFINHNVDAAEDWLQELEPRDSELADRVIINPNGVTCDQICGSRPDVHVGIVGICTSDFCKCHQDTGFHNEGWGHYRATAHYDELRCVHGKIFDPVSLRCRDPRETVLCADLPRGSEFGHGWGSQSPPSTVGHLRETEYGWVWEDKK